MLPNAISENCMKHLRETAIQITKDNIHEYTKLIVKTIDEMEGIFSPSDKCNGVSAIEIGLKLPLIVMKDENGCQNFLNPTVSIDGSSSFRSYESSVLTPTIHSVAIRPSKIKIRAYHVNHLGELKATCVTYASQKAGKFMQLYSTLKGVFYLDQAERLPKFDQNERRTIKFVYRVSHNGKADYFVEGSNKLFFAELIINPLDYEEKDLVPVAFHKPITHKQYEAIRNYGARQRSGSKIIV